MMPTEDKNSNSKSPNANKLHFWFLVSFSLLLIVVFVYWLPLRFEHQAGEENQAHDDEMSNHIEDMAGHAGHAGHTLPDTSSLEGLPLRTPANRVSSLPFVEKDGVKEFELTASEFRWEYEPGKWVHVWGYNGQIPGPEIRVNEGDAVRIMVKNNLPDATTVHWHGLDVPWQMDGVANVTQQAIPPGGEYTYEFDAVPAGTRFYHTHGKDHTTAAQQLDMGLSGAFIVEPQTVAYPYDKEFTLVLDEWDIQNGVNSALSHVHGAGEEGAVPEYNTFTINGNIFPYVDPLLIQSGERVLVRFINAGTTAFHPMHLHGHSFDVVAKDGFPIERTAIETRSTITINPGETVDILVYANNPGPWLLHCHHVHHAAAGMITLLQYEGYEPIGTPDKTAEQARVNELPMNEVDNHHASETGVVDDHHAGEEVLPHAHEPAAGSGSGVWWGLLVTSIILITLLGLGVRKYLRVT